MPPSRDKARRFEEQPIHDRLGFQFRSRANGTAEVALPPRSEHLQLDGVVHGGVLATLMDTAAVYSIYPDLAGVATLTSIEFKINFLRPARLERGELSACAKALKVGRSIATSEVELVQAGELMAKGIFTYFVLEGGRAAEA